MAVHSMAHEPRSAGPKGRARRVTPEGPGGREAQTYIYKPPAL